MLWGVLGVIAGVVLLDLLIHAIAVLYVLPILERCPPFGVEPTSPIPLAEPISFTTSDGIVLRGSLHPPVERPPCGLIIFCPELGGDHWSASWYCRALLNAGFTVLSFDFRNQGESDRLAGYAPIHWLTEFEVNDALAAIEYARSRPDLADLPMGLFGISRGGSAALVATARRPEVRCVACEGVFSISSTSLYFTLKWATLYLPAWLMRLLPNWHLRMTLAIACRVSQLRRHCRYIILENWLSRLGNRPTLMIVDGRDTYVLPEVSETLFQSFPKASSTLWLVESAKHNMARQVDATQFDRRIVEFFSQLLTLPNRQTAQSRQRPLEEQRSSG